MIQPRFYYLTSLFFIFVIPAIIAGYFVISRIPLLNLLMFVIGITILGSIFDIWATRHGKRDPVWLWQFNDKDIFGIKLFDLPIEEYLFFIASSIYIIFIWEGIQYALETGSALMYILIPFLGIWSLVFICVPYFIRMKGDRL